MKNPVLPADSLSALFQRPGVLAVVRGSQSGAVPEPFVLILDDGSITGFNGHVDLGTGIRTSLAQIVAEELDVPVGRVSVVMGDTDRTLNQGGASSSNGIQKGGMQLHDDDGVARFLRKHFLHWLEALGWMGRTPDAVLSVKVLEPIALVSHAYCRDIRQLTDDIGM